MESTVLATAHLRAEFQGPASQFRLTSTPDGFYVQMLGSCSEKEATTVRPSDSGYLFSQHLEFKVGVDQTKDNNNNLLRSGEHTEWTAPACTQGPRIPESALPFTTPSVTSTYGTYRHVPAPTSLTDLYTRTAMEITESAQLTLISLRLFGFFTRRK